MRNMDFSIVSLALKKKKKKDPDMGEEGGREENR